MRILSGILIAIFLLLNVTQIALAQVPIIVNPNQAPSHLNWKEIHTKHFKVIYPEAISKRAHKVAEELEYFYPKLERTLKADFKKLTVVLQTESTQANGYVALAPWRSHWITTPYIGDSLGATEWLETLAIHEQRHVFQLAKYRQGFSNIMYYLFGETGQLLMTSWGTPNWFFEGDAVVEETLLTNSGRGRIPEFTNHLRAMLLKTTLPEYDKMYLRSLKDFIPNHYPVGYVLSNYMREANHADIIDRVFDDAAYSAWSPFALENSITQNTGTKFEDFYQYAFYNLKTFFELRDKEITPSPFANIDHKHSLFEQNNIMDLYGNLILTYRTGLSFAPHFSLFNPKTKTYQRLFRTNNYLGNKVSIVNHKFVFQDYKMHPRYLAQDYSDIFLFDLKTNEKKQITFKEKYFIPELAPDGKSIFALSFQKDFRAKIVKLNLNGKKLREQSLNFYELPISITVDGQNQISFISRDKKGFFHLKQMNFLTGNSKTLLSRNDGTMNYLRKIKDGYLFNANFDGQENIYKFYVKDKFLQKRTESRFGASRPNQHHKKIIYNEYDLKGNSIAETSSVQTYPTYYGQKYYVEKIIKKDQLLNRKTDAPSKAISKEQELDRDLINVHSWDYITSILSPFQVLSIRSDDVLNELGLSTGVLYHSSEKSVTYFAGADYQKYWPIFHLRGDIGKRTIFTNYGQENEEVFSWHQNSFNVGFSLPYSSVFSGNTLSMSLTHLKGYRYISNKNYPGDEQNGELNISDTSFDMSLFGEQSIRDIKPRYGFELKLNKQDDTTQIGVTPDASLESYQTALYFPGLSDHHHFYTTFGTQKKTIGSYDLPDLMPFARGYGEGSFEKMDKFTLNYALPLFYPDYALGRYMYTKRMRANLFFDHLKTSTERSFRSYGLELLFDVNLFRNLNLPLSWGVRSSYLLDDPLNEFNHELFLESELTTF